MKSLGVLLYCILSSIVAEASSGTDTTGRHGFFYRGTEFTKIFTVQSGTPFLNAEGPALGWVVYYGARYDSVMIQYDIEDDQLVSHDITGAIRMQLVKEKISAFGFSGREFVRLPGSDMFFERIYHDHHDVLARWQKVLTRTGTEESRYRLYKMIFISNGKEVVEVQNNSDLVRYFGKNGKQVKEYLRNEGLSMKKDPEKTTSAVIRYADQIGLHEQ
ncbi:MAG TPA: hypothetical protein VK166_04615 [Chitinophagaceae bacterium]|nr:hypothetical protein [Chitinophagaceae bacterium]